MEIISGESGNKLGVSAGKSARTTLYYEDRLGGVSEEPAELARGAVTVYYERTTANTPQPIIFYTLRNSGTSRLVRIHCIRIWTHTSNVGGSTFGDQIRIDQYTGVTGIGTSGGGTTSTQTPSIFKTALGQATHIESTSLNSIAFPPVNSLVMTGGTNYGQIATFFIENPTIFAGGLQLTPYGTGFYFLNRPSVFDLYWNPLDLMPNEAIAFTMVNGAFDAGETLIISSFFTEISV